MLYSEEKRIKIRKSRKFSKTNKPWNDLHLNQVKSIGSVMYLIKKFKPISVEEWAECYFGSGVERELMISLNKTAPSNKEIQKKLVSEYGRTEEELIEIAKKFQSYCDNSLELAYNYVYIRVIDQTFIGYQKEVMAINEIRNFININKLPMEIKETDIEKDIKYSVDFEVYFKGKRVLGVQLKPSKYKKVNVGYMNMVKGMNLRKNKEYTERYGIPVIYLYYIKDTILNISDLEDFFKEEKLLN